MIYDWPLESDWRRGVMRSAPLAEHGKPRAPWASPWDFIHLAEECRWADCDFHRPTVVVPL